jgi:pyruvate/2-oxoglutarate dehydrogenase complex dihydrolipoamide acyltransferase (E2) component
MSESVQVKVPFENVNDPTAKIVDWKFPSGSKVKEGDSIVELETTKTTFPVLAPADGFVEYHFPVGEEVPVGGDLFRIHANELAAKAAALRAAKTETAPLATNAAPTTGAPMISKRAQELMAANGLNISAFMGMNVVKESDVREKLASLVKPPPQPTPDKLAGAAVSKKIIDEPGQLVPLERAKQLENRELSQVNHELLKSTVHYFCRAERLQEACAKQVPPVQRLVVLLFELVKLLRKFPSLNAYYSDSSMFVYAHVHIGFAVDMGHGLKVLVVREAENLNFAEFTDKVEELLVKYATGGLAVKEITGSTFTVTDLAQTGVFAFEPLVNSRQAAILGIGSEIQLAGPSRNGFMLSCAFDHRLTTGRVVAEFLAEFSSRIVAHAASLRAAIQPEPLYCSRCLQTVDELRAVQAFLIPSAEPPGYLCSNCLSGH